MYTLSSTFFLLLAAWVAITGEPVAAAGGFVPGDTLPSQVALGMMAALAFFSQAAFGIGRAANAEYPTTVMFFVTITSKCITLFFVAVGTFFALALQDRTPIAVVAWLGVPILYLSTGVSLALGQIYLKTRGGRPRTLLRSIIYAFTIGVCVFLLSVFIAEFHGYR